MYKYKSFISYSRAADNRLAPEIKSALQGFAKSWYQLRAIQVFCDQTNLTANPDLWNSIEKNLAASEFFIYLASPQAAKSKWVKKEIAFFHSKGNAGKMLIVLTDGNIVWDDEKTDFNWELTDAVPQLDEVVFAQEPTWVDLKWIRKEQLSARDPRFLDTVANLSATLRDMDKDTLIGKDVEEHRKAKRFRLFSMTGLSLLAIFLIIASIFAIRSERISQERLVKTFVNNGIGLLEKGDYAMAQPWFIEALANERKEEKKELNEYRIENIFTQIPALAQVWQTELPVLKTAFLPNKHILMLSGNKENWWTNEYECFNSGSDSCKALLQVLNTETGENVFEPVLISDGVRAAAINEDKTLFVSLSIWNKLRLWDLRNGKLIWEQPMDIPVTKEAFYSNLVMVFNRQNSHLLFMLENHINIYETGKGKIVAVYESANSTIGNAAFLADGNSVMFQEESLRIGNITSNKTVIKKLPFFDNFSGFELSPDQLHIIVTGENKKEHFQEFGTSISGFACLNLANMEDLLFIKDAEGTTLKMAFDAGGNVLGTNSSYTTEGGSADEGTMVWSMENGIKLSGWIKLSQEVDISFDSSGQKMAITCNDGTTEIWQVSGQNASKRLWLLYDGNIDVKSIFSPDNQYLLTSGSERLIKLWKIPDLTMIRSAMGPDLDDEKEPADTTLKWHVVSGRSDNDTAYTDSSLAYIYDIKTARKIGNPLKHNSEVHLASISNNGNYIATAALNEACVWSAGTQEKLYNISYNKNVELQDIYFSPDSKKILTSFTDYTSRVWDAKTGQPITPYIKHPFSSTYVDHAMARFSRDGKKIITTDHDTYYIWDAGTGEPLSAPLPYYSAIDESDTAAKTRNPPGIFSIKSLSINELKSYSELISGKRLDTNSSFISLSADEFMEQWKKWKETTKNKRSIND